MIKYLKQYADKTFEELVNSLIWFDNPLKLKAIFEKISSTFLTEAPVDGNQYARKDGEWDVVSSTSGDFIPLSGTTTGNPVTGYLQMSDGVEVYSENSTRSSLYFEDGYLWFNFINSILEGSQLVLSDTGLNISSLTSTFRGIIGAQDFTLNIKDLDYPQKIYVDGLRGKYISKTTTEINAIVTPQAGETYFNTTLSTLCFWDGSAWQQVTHSVM